MINTNKYFIAAEKRGVAPFELNIDIAKEEEIELFDGKVEGFNIAEQSSVYGRGVYNGKIGAFLCDSYGKEVPAMMIDNIIETAEYGQEITHPLFVNKGLKYKKIRNYHSELESVDATVLTELAKKVHQGAEKVGGVSEIEVYVATSSSESIKKNSLGLKLSSKENYVSVTCGLVAKEGTLIESGYDTIILTSLEGFDAGAFGEKVALDTKKKLNGKSIRSGYYKAVLKEECVASLLKPLLSKLSAYDIQHDLSLFKDCLGKKKLSSKLTVENKPISQSVFASSYDAEGTPRANFKLIKNGVVENYIYDLDTAHKDNVASNGCGRRDGTNVKPALGYITVKSGKKSFDEIVAEIGEGVYITSLQGIHAGLESTSGNFSLQSSGYLIHEGKIDRPISLITVAGNLFTLFEGISAIGSDAKETLQAVSTPVIAFKKLSISGSEE